MVICFQLKEFHQILRESNPSTNYRFQQNITEIKSLLGMTNFCNKLIPEYSTITAPLRQLTKKMNHSAGDHNNKLLLTS